MSQSRHANCYSGEPVSEDSPRGICAGGGVESRSLVGDFVEVRDRWLGC